MDDLPWGDLSRSERLSRLSQPSPAAPLGTYPRCDIDKPRERGETWAVDPETGEAINRLSANLDRVGTNVDRLGANVDRLGADLDRLSTDLRGEIRSTEAETRAYVDQRIQTSTVEMRRFFEVVGESLRGEIRSVAELVALSNEQRDRGDDEQTVRSDGLERRVQRLEVDVSRLKADRKSRRPRRR